MRFHLDYTPEKSRINITNSNKVMLIGSCFSENIGDRLRTHKFKTLLNPNGILFNPASIAAALDTMMATETVNDKHILNRDGLFYSFMHHSSINATSQNELIKKITEINKQAADFLKNADILLLTFGSAFAYRHLQLNKTVANCHKQPGSTFEKKLLSVEQITKNYSVLIQHLQLFNPDLKIIFTVSPVKYLKDGITENNLSKSVLLLSVHELVKKFSNCEYFPAYELVNDDLRDYRFYKEDLAHPNEQAINYVWEKFSDCYFDEKTKNLNDKIHKLNLALRHRTMNTGSEETKKLEDFISKQKDEIRKVNPKIEF